MAGRKDKTITLKDGKKLGYAEYGDPKGKPLFYFHGWPGSRHSGIETDSAAKKLRVRVISPDRPGIGLSDYKKGRTLLDWPDDVAELADRLKIKKFAVMGCSGGGPYVAACAYKIPERLTKAGIVVGLAPVTVKGNLDGMLLSHKVAWQNYSRLPVLRAVSTLGAWLEFSNPILGKLFAFPTENDRDTYHNSLIHKKEKYAEAFRQGLKGESEELRIYTADWGFKLRDIKSKVFLWYGAKDKCVSLNMGKYYESQIPDSKLFVDPEGGHLSRYNFEDKILKTLTE